MYNWRSRQADYTTKRNHDNTVLQHRNKEGFLLPKNHREVERSTNCHCLSQAKNLYIPIAFIFAKLLTDTFHLYTRLLL